MIRKEKRELAHKIVKYEKEMRLGKNVKSNEQKIQELISHLNPRELMELDEYIISKNFLDKS